MRLQGFGESVGPWLSIPTAFLLLCFPNKVKCQCLTGAENGCRWTNEGPAALLWITEIQSGEPVIRLEKCENKKCGIGKMVSPWLPPSTSQQQLNFYLKIYGDGNVYLRLHMKKENENDPARLFSKTFNYGDNFPETWSFKTVAIPASESRFQLIMEAKASYSDAFVAVKGLAINDPSSDPVGPPPSSSSSSTTTTTTELPVVPPTPSTTSTTTEGNDIEYPDEGEREDDIEMFQELEDGRFVTVEDIVLGHTTVVYPEVCKY